jgi:hypothetical protein
MDHRVSLRRDHRVADLSTRRWLQVPTASMEERMGALLSTRIRRWLLLMVGVPVLAWALERIGNQLEARKGPSTVSRGFQQAGAWVHRRSWRGKY